jgi:hypothetical protein
VAQTTLASISNTAKGRMEYIALLWSDVEYIDVKVACTGGIPAELFSKFCVI